MADEKENKRKINIKIAAVVISVLLNSLGELKKWKDRKAKRLESKSIRLLKIKYGLICFQIKYKYLACNKLKQ